MSKNNGSELAQRIQAFDQKLKETVKLAKYSPLDTAGRQAWELVNVMRAQGIEAYVYHDRYKSIVTVGAFQSAPLNSSWVALWDRANPESPLNTYRDGTTARVQVQAITFLKRAGGADDLAQVRFIRGVRPGGNGQEQLTHYLATIQYGYGTPSHDDHTRTLNPLGFRVLEYRREAEVAADTVVAGAMP